MTPHEIEMLVTLVAGFLAGVAVAMMIQDRAEGSPIEERPPDEPADWWKHGGRPPTWTP